MYWDCDSFGAIEPVREFARHALPRKLAGIVPARSWPYGSACLSKWRSALHTSLTQAMRNAESRAPHHRRFPDARRSPMQPPANRWPSPPPKGEQKFRHKQASRKDWRDDRGDAVESTEWPRVRPPCRRLQAASPDWLHRPDG